MRWVEELGLGLDVLGTLVLASGLLISRSRALELGKSYLAGETDEENLNLPPVHDRLLQARNARVGVVLLVAGFVCQAVANWP